MSELGRRETGKVQNSRWRVVAIALLVGLALGVVLAPLAPWQEAEVKNVSLDEKISLNEVLGFFKTFGEDPTSSERLRIEGIVRLFEADQKRVREFRERLADAVQNSPAEEATVRMVRLAGWFQDESGAIAKILLRYLREASPEMQQHILPALAQLKARPEEDLLLALVSSDDMHVRWLALFLAGQNGEGSEYAAVYKQAFADSLGSMRAEAFRYARKTGALLRIPAKNWLRAYLKQAPQSALEAIPPEWPEVGSQCIEYLERAYDINVTIRDHKFGDYGQKLLQLTDRLDQVTAEIRDGLGAPIARPETAE